MSRVYNRRSELELRRTLRRASTPAEQLLWTHLRNNQLGHKFRRQYAVSGYCLDFYCPSLHLAIELDGESHDSPEAQLRDRDRQLAIESYRIHFLRFTNADLYHNLEQVLQTISATLLSLSSPSHDEPHSV